MLHLVAAHAAPSHLWGLSAAAFAPRWLEALCLVAAVLLLVPRVAGAFARRASAAWTAVATREGRLNPRAIVVAFASMALFFALRSRNGFLGDGFLRLDQLAAGQAPLRSAGFLDILLHREAWRVARAAGFADAALVYAAVSALLGALAVCILPGLARRVVPDPGTRWIVPALLLVMGSVQLWFGYSEDYTLRELVMVAYFAAALAALRGGSSWPAVALLAIGVASHLTFLALAPSVVALFVQGRAAPLRRAFVILGIGIAAALVAVALLAFGRRYGGLDALVPVLPGPDDAYGWLSPAHFADLANFALLIAPATAALTVILLARVARGEEPGARDFLARASGFQREPLFWTLAVAGVVAGSFLVDPKLGSRDWDLMAFAGLPVTLAVARLVGRAPRSAGPVVATLFGAGLLHVAPWVAVNHDPVRGADLALSMAWDDAHHRSGPTPRLMTLGVIYDHHGFRDHARRLHRRAIEVRPDNALAHFNLGTVLLQDGETDAAVRALERAITLNPREDQARVQLGVAYGMQGRIPEALAQLRIAVDLAPARRESWIDLGIAWLHASRPDSAAFAWERALALDPGDAGLHARIAGLYRELGATALALQHAREAVRLNPGDSPSRDLLRMLENAP